MTLRFFYPPALRNLRQSFSRAGKWIIMRWGKVSFDRHTTTRRQAAGMVLGALIVPLCLAAGVGWASWFWCGVVAMTYLTVVWPFLDFCRHHKGWFYVPVAMGLHVLVALVVTAGAVRAVLWRLTRVGPMDELLAARDA